MADLSFEHPAQHLVLEELVQRIERAEVLGERVAASMVELLPRWALAPVVEAVQALRRISILNAITLVAEIGSFSRFDNPRQLMAYLGLVPSEHSSGSTVRRGRSPLRQAGDRQQPGAPTDARSLGRGSSSTNLGHAARPADKSRINRRPCCPPPAIHAQDPQQCQQRSRHEDAGRPAHLRARALAMRI